MVKMWCGSYSFFHKSNYDRIQSDEIEHTDSKLLGQFLTRQF